ncbi:MAG: glycosyltransferase family 4 protein [Lentisphaeria bacterium]|nr:glycosyltransferase family 4 protein [Lentisphaeria bacterium]
MPEKPLKICHVITRMIVGGAQENTLLSVKGQMEDGHEVVLLTGPTTGPEGTLLGTAAIPGLRVVEEPALIRAVNPLKDWVAYRRLKNHFLAEKYAVVHTHASKAGIIGRAAAWSARVPLVVHTVHGQAFHRYETWWRNKLYITMERFAARRCHHIFAVAEAMIDQCVKAGVAPREKYSVVYSGMDMDAFLNARPEPELRAALGIPENAPVIGKIARLFDLKGHDYLFEAAPAIVAEFPEARFILVGDGILKAEFQKKIKSMGLEENFIFTGLVPPGDVPRYTALMDVLAHLSLREGLPRTVVQALAAGKPAVGFDLDGTPEVIQEGETGHLCPPEDARAVELAILDLLRHPRKAQDMGATGRQRVRKNFDWRHMAACLQEAYYRLLG